MPQASIARLGWMLETAIIRRALVAASLVVLVMVGLFVTNFSRHYAFQYWTAMFPAFGAICAWHLIKADDLRTSEPIWQILLRLTLHWAGPIVAIRILFLQLARGQMDADAVALMAVMFLAVTCFLAGLHLDGSFIWASALLAIAAIIGTDVEAYIWIIALVALVATAVAAYAGIVLMGRRNASYSSASQ
jgi:hypothetical protein